MVFFYARRDRILRDRLEDHLSTLKYRGLITTWHDQEIYPGANEAQQIDESSRAAHIVLLLVSSHSLASYYNNKEIQQVMERHKQREADVIPILLRPVMLEGVPFAGLQMLPSNGKPVVKWRDRDSAFVNVAYGIERVARKYTEAILLGDDQLLSDDPLLESIDLSPFADELSPEQREEAREIARKRRYYEMSIEIYQTALSRNPFDGLALRSLGNTLYGLERYNEAHEILLQAIQYAPTASAYASLGNVLASLQHNEEAAANYTRAFELDPTAPLNYHHWEQALLMLGKTREAQEIHARSLLLDDSNDAL